MTGVQTCALPIYQKHEDAQMTFDEWFVRYPLPAEIDTMDDTDREQWTWALRSAYKTGMLVEREACAKVADEFDPEMKMSNYGQVIANRIRARGQA